MSPADSKPDDPEPGASKKSSAQSRSRTKSGLDPDQLAELERERDYLLRSLDDLDAELAAGDLAEVDFQALNDDYTRRLAEVARSIDQRKQAFASVDNRLSTRQRVGTVLALLVVGVLAGLLLARASGFRSPDASTTGDIRQTSSGLLAEADTLTREGRWPEAVDVYSEVLDLAPGNAEALTYRGWLTARLGDAPAGLVDISEAVVVDPEYPDARIFSVLLLNQTGDYVAAAEQLKVVDELDVPAEMMGLIEASNVRASVAAGQIQQLVEPGAPVDLSQVVGSLDDIARAGALLSQQGQVVLAQATFDAVLDADPDQVVALVGKGQLGRFPGVFAEDPEVAAAGLAALDRAVELAPDEQVIRLYRADARAVQGDLQGAQSDLASIDVSGLSADVLPLYEQLSADLTG